MAMTPQELSKLDYEGASELLLAYATDAKKYEREIAALKSQAEEWKSKAALARSRAMPELSEAASQKASELEAKAQELSLELAGLRRDIGQLREALPIIKAKQRRVDPDLLLAELSMIVGDLGEGKPAEPGSGATDGGTAAGKDAHGSAAGAASTPGAPGAEPSSRPPNNPPAGSIDDALAELKKKMGLL
jgi:hypothetical protein